MDTHHTAKDLSPQELAQYHQRLDQHFQNRKVDEALLQRAWHTAHRIAAMLYKDLVQRKLLCLDRLLNQSRSQNGRISILPSGVFRTINISGQSQRQ